jgi:type II secretory pathway pseudopilin PulG
MFAYLRGCYDKCLSRFRGGPRKAEGFTLIEVVIAFIVVMVAMLGIVQAFVYATNYNAGNKARGEALAVMQQEVERLRSLKFTPGFTHPELSAGIHTNTITTPSQLVFTVTDEIDNDPLVDGIQLDSYNCTTPQGTVIPCSIKEITITVVLEAPSPGWQTHVAAKTVLRRTRGN